MLGETLSLSSLDRPRDDPEVLEGSKGRSSHEFPQRALQRILERRGAVARAHRVHRFLRHGPMVAQILERGDKVVPQLIAARLLLVRADLRGRDVPKAILQLEDDALGGLLADAGAACEPRDIR